MHIARIFVLLLAPLILHVNTAFADALPGNEAIIIQGKGPAKTRTFAINDNWHVEVTSDAAVKVDSISGDGATTTTLLNFPASTPPPPTYSGASAVVPKGGSYTLSIDTPGNWQVTIAEGGFSKNFTIGGSPVPAPSIVTAAPAAPIPAAASATTPAPSAPSPMPQHIHHTIIATLNRQTDPALNRNETTADFVASSDWTIRWHTSKGVKITLDYSNGSKVLVDDTSIASTAEGNHGGEYPQNRISPYPHSPYNSNPYAPNQGTPPFTPGMFLGSCAGSGAGTFHFEVEGPGSWGITVMGTTTDSSTDTASNSALNASQTPAASTNAPATTPAAPVSLPEDQARAVVLIKGDNAEGTGFMIKTPDGPVVITNIHVIANNPNLKITTNTGALVTVLSEKGASDRDLAMLSIKDAGYNYLQFSTDISKEVQPGDDVITPGNSQGGEVMLNTAGKVLGIGPVRLEINNPIYHGNSGGPVFHTKSGKVLGVVTEAEKIDVSDDLDKASFASRNSAISGSMRYFGLRLDTVSAWIPIDSRRFQTETTFLDEFHEQSRRLDAYLNHSDKDRDEAARLYHGDEKIMKANNSYLEHTSGADTAQHIDLVRSLVFDLQCIADLNVEAIKDKTNFYSFDQERAQDEYDYRKALKRELDSIAGNVERASFLPRSNN